MSKIINPQWFVYREISWPDGEYNVCIVRGGIDNAGPNMLVPGFPGEGITYDSAVEAVETAYEIAKKWTKIKPDESINIGIGSTLGGSLPMECDESTDETYEQMMKYAKDFDENKVRRCDLCNEIMRKEWKMADDWTGERFCSEQCVEKVYEYYQAALDDEDGNDYDDDEDNEDAE